MSVHRKIAKNTSVLVIDRVFSLILGFFTLGIISRHLGLESFGKYSLVQSLVPIFLFLSTWGLDTILIREVAKNRQKADELIGKVFMLKLVLTALGLSVCWVTALILHYPSDVILGIFIYSAVLLLSPLRSYLLIFQVDLRNEFMVIASVISTSLFAGLVVLGTSLGAGLIFMISVLTLKAVVVYIIGGIFANKIVKPHPKIDLRMWKVFAKEAAPVGIAALFAELLKNFGIIVLSKVDGAVAVGIYSAAWRLLVIIYFIPQAFMVSVFPLMSRYYALDEHKLKVLYKRALDYMFMMAVPIAVGVTLVGSKIISFVFGAEYTASSLALKILIWQAVLVFPWMCQANLLISLNKQKTYLLLTSVATLFNVAASIVSILWAGYIGYAIVSVITFIPVLVWATVLIYREMGYFVSLSTMVKIIAACGIMGFVLLVAPTGNILILMILGFVAYWGGLFLFRGITGSEVKLLLRG